MTDKATLRKTLRDKRAQLTDEQVARASHAITEKLLCLADWSAFRSVHVYASQSAWNEIRTDELIAYLREKYPKLVIDSPGHTPNATRPNTTYDAIIVPVLGFDAHGYRLGLGKGWYDRFLVGQPQAQKIGIAYAWARCNHLPHETHDVPLNAVITD